MIFCQQKSMPALLASLCAGLLHLAGCGSATGTNSGTKAAVTLSQLHAAVQSINTIDYLPFSRTEDGCYARSLYMAMEIAARGIPVSSQYLIATSGSLQPEPGYHWDYHIAPTVWVEGENEPFILDPSLFNRVVKRSEWVTKLNPTGEHVLKFSPASVTAVGSSRLKPGPVLRSEMMTRLSEVGKFPASDIIYSCRIMSAYIDQETHLSLADRARKQERLTTRTKQLLKVLRGYGLGPDSSAISDRPTDCY
jgi:hypothetical protein